MDHSHMDHGSQGAPADDMCSMSMLFTWDTTNLCIVFRQWHVRSFASLVFSLLAVVGLAMGYEALRSYSRHYEACHKDRIDVLPNDEDVTETSTMLSPGQNKAYADQRGHIIKAALYASQTFYAFMLMLLFMTYNGWVMLAVTIGAFLGYLLFGHSTSATRDNACH